MPVEDPPAPVLHLRVALTSHDFKRLTKFYLDGLGLEPAQVWESGPGHGLAIDMGSASLELFDETYARGVDEIEAGQRIIGPVRLAIQVPNLKAAVARLLAHGATMVHPPVTTPWGDTNARMQDPDGLQVTLYEVKRPLDTGS